MDGRIVGGSVRGGGGGGGGGLVGSLGGGFAVRGLLLELHPS